MMRVLIACEISGVVRDAFRNQGYDAYSCDIQASTDTYHYQGCAIDIAYGLNWDLMIAHPPCTHLAVSGARWFPEKIADGRQKHAIDFATKLWNAPIPRIAIENPISVLATHIRKSDQIVQPWWFGDEYTKSTCLWLKNLPKLTPTNIVDKGGRIKYPSGASLPAWYANARVKDRSNIRSKTFKGMAEAMAIQWSF